MIIIIGIAGSGKSTQGQLLAEYLGYKWLSTGEILRSRTLPSSIQKIMSSGGLVSDEEMIQILDDALSKEECAKIILDGFPRSLDQTEWLITQHKSNKRPINSVIHLVADHKVILERLLSRGRPDDREEVIMHRFDEYEAVTKPMIEKFIAAKVNVLDINADDKIEPIQELIRTELGKL